MLSGVLTLMYLIVAHNWMMYFLGEIVALTRGVELNGSIGVVRWGRVPAEIHSGMW